MLDSLLPTDRIEADLRDVFSSGEARIELEGGNVAVAADVRLELVSRAFYSHEFDIGFGRAYYRVIVAVGGIRSLEYGILEAQLCFATLWYSEARDLITVDFAEALL